MRELYWFEFMDDQQGMINHAYYVISDHTP